MSLRLSPCATAAVWLGPGSVPGIASQALGFLYQVCVLCRDCLGSSPQPSKGDTGCPGTQGLWLAWISPSAQPWVGPGALPATENAGCSVTQPSACLAHKFYWYDLAFWLIGELTSSKAILVFLVCVELLHGFDCGLFVQCEVMAGHQS